MMIVNPAVNTHYCEEPKMENDSTYVRVLIERDDNRSVVLSLWAVEEIEQYILDRVCADLGKRPRFSGAFVFSEEGALIVSPHVDTLNWLRNVIKSYSKKALKITGFKDSPQYTASVKAEFPRSDHLLELLEVQNVGLQTESWRILDVGAQECSYAGSDCGYATFLIDDPGRVFLERNDFKLFLGMATIQFELIERVKRCKITGKIVPDDKAKN